MLFRSAEFIQEVEQRLMEETDYKLELKRSMDLSARCSHIPGLVFPAYYPELSSGKILTMDWLDGKPLGEMLGKGLPADAAQHIAQSMWDFYHFQMHTLQQVHADPHPGNFIVTPDYRLGVIDFGCVKVIPDAFYKTYFRLLDRDLLNHPAKLEEVFFQLRFIHPSDTAKERQFYVKLFSELVELLSRPFESDTFDFSDDGYFETLYAYGEKLAAMPELRQSKQARGVKDALYINRNFEADGTAGG